MSVQLLETEPSSLLVLGCGTVYQPTLSRVTHFHSSAENVKHFYLDNLILISCFSFSSWSLRFLPRDALVHSAVMLQ